MDKRSSPAGAKWKLVAQAAFDDAVFWHTRIGACASVFRHRHRNVCARAWCERRRLVVRGSCVVPTAGARPGEDSAYSDNPDASWAVDGHAVNAVFSLSEFEALEQAVGSIMGTMAALRVPDSTAIESGCGGPRSHAQASRATTSVLSAAPPRLVASSTGPTAPETMRMKPSSAIRCGSADSAKIERLSGGWSQSMIAGVTIIGVAARNFAGIDVSRVDLWMQYGSAVSGDGRSAYRDNRVAKRRRTNWSRSDSAVLVARATVGYRTVAASMQKCTLHTWPILRERGPETKSLDVLLAERLAEGSRNPSC